MDAYTLGEQSEPVVDMWLGFRDSLSAERNTDSNPTVLTMVCEICEYNFEYFQEKFPNRFKYGDWFVSAGICNELVINGPFKRMQEALNFSRDNYNTEYFKFAGW